MTEYPENSILAFLDVLPSGALAKSAAGLLGAAAAEGTAVALVVTAPGVGAAAADAAAAFGAGYVLVAEMPEVSGVVDGACRGCAGGGG